MNCDVSLLGDGLRAMLIENWCCHECYSIGVLEIVEDHHIESWRRFKSLHFMVRTHLHGRVYVLSKIFDGVLACRQVVVRSISSEFIAV